jgi:acetolactate synthase small subunit
MPKTCVITAKAENVLRVLQKLTSLMSRKRLKVQDMQVSETSSPGVSYLILTLQADADHVQWLAKQMKKCVDLFDLDLKLPIKKLPLQAKMEEKKDHEWKELYANLCGFVLF